MSTITLAVITENSKSNALAMEGKSKAGVRRLGRGSKAEYYGDSDSVINHMLGNLQRHLDLLKVQEHSKYLIRYELPKSQECGGRANGGKK